MREEDLGRRVFEREFREYTRIDAPPTDVSAYLEEYWEQLDAQGVGEGEE